MSYNTNAKKKIEMPPIGEVSPIEQLTNPASSYQAVQQSSPEGEAVFNAVPDSVPDEIEEEYSVEEEFDQPHETEEVVQEELERVVPPTKSAGENFKELRLARERAEKEKEKVEKERDALLAHLLSMQGTKKESPKVEELDFDEFSVSDDAFIEGRDYKRLAQHSRKQAELTARKLKEYEQRIEDMATEARIRTQYPDIDQVVTDENVYLLRERYPAIAKSLNNAPNDWDKYSSVYTLIKELGIHKSRSYEYDKLKAVSNSQKPKPAASLSPQQGDSPLTQVNAFIQDRKMSKEGMSSLWKQMKEDMKRV